MGKKGVDRFVDAGRSLSGGRELVGLSPLPSLIQRWWLWDGHGFSRLGRHHPELRSCGGSQGLFR